MKGLKRAALAAARAGGVFALVRDSAWRQQRLLVLCYHGTSLRDEHRWSPTLYVPQEQLRRRFMALRDGGYAVLPLAEAAARLAAGTLPPRAVSITFDDGTHDFAARAVPVIREFQLPVTLYLTTFYCNYQRPVFDPMCAYLLWRGDGRTIDLEGILPEGGEVRLRGDVARRAVSERLFVHTREARLAADAKDALARTIAERVGVDYDEILRERLIHIMDADEVRALPHDLVDVQLHTHRHRTPRDEALFRREIEDNRREIARLLPAAPTATHFCYPSGFHRPEFLPWLRDLGVVTATTCETGLAERGRDPLAMPRFIDTCHLNDDEFAGWLTGVSAWLPRRSEAMSIAHQVALRDDVRPPPMPERLPSIGVVMPCYNGAPYLERAIASVRAQTVPVSRIVVVDDASTDDSVRLATSLGVEVLTVPANRGPSAARNRGIAALDTELVAFLDTDDFWRPDHLETLVPLMPDGVAVAFSDAVRTDGTAAPQRAGLVPGQPLDLLPVLLLESPVPQSGSLVRREVLDDVGGYDEAYRLSEDFELWLRIASRHRLVYSGRPTCIRRVHAGQASRDRRAMIRGGWAARRKLWRAVANSATPARGVDPQASRAAMTAAWEGSMRAAIYLRDRTLARELLGYRAELSISDAAWRRWWWQVEVFWQPRRVISALWRRMQPASATDELARLPS
ncbi:MAG: glycosyltransferase [Gemmatimonadetes bacterium]|nr:glycosyltransferase [Gemmatimonadota bacterium]